MHKKKPGYIGAALISAVAGSCATWVQAETSTQSAVLEEVVVNAQRRSENIQDVPIAITAITPEKLTDLNLVKINDITMVTPSLVFDAGYGYAQKYIRGVGTSIPNPGLEGAVSTYIDGSYLQRDFGIMSDMFDIANIQVLKGPQGTLWGRNATGGAILLTTADPTQDRSVHVAGEYGNLGHAVGELIANTPLSDTVALRLGVRSSHDDGFVDNLFDGSKFGGKRSEVYRAKLSWQPANNFSALYTFEYGDQVDGANGLAERAPAPLCAACAIPGSGAAPVSGFYKADTDGSTPYRTHSVGSNLHLQYDLDHASIESITSYRDENTKVDSDQDYTRFPLFQFLVSEGGETFTEDLHATTDYDGMLNGAVGLSYLHDNAHFDVNFTGAAFAQLLQNGLGYPGARNNVETDSSAVFAEVYLKATEKLTFTLGGRYTKDKRTLTGSENLEANLSFAPPGSPLDWTQDYKSSSFTPRVVAAYALDNVNLYASYNKGYKAGGFSTPVFSATHDIKSETIDSYEVGAKFVSDDNRIQVNTAAFYYIYNDIQVPIIDLQAGGISTENAGKADGKGLEVDGSFAATHWLTLSGGASYLDAKYTKYPNASINVPTDAGLVGGVEDEKGQPLNHAPDFTAFLSGNVHFPVGQTWVGDLNAVARYTSEYDYYPGRGGPLRYDYQPAYTLVNLTGRVGPSDQSYSLGFYVDNLTDERYYVQRVTSAPFGQFDQVAKPRTYGLRVTANF